MPTEMQLISILKTYGISEKSMKILDDTSGISIFAKLNKGDQSQTGRDTQRYPHISPPKGETPAHITDIRFVKTAGSYDVFQRFHRHINDDLTIGSKLHDRFQAVERNSGAIHSVGVEGRGPKARDVWNLNKLRELNFKIGLQIKERQNPAFMSRAVMNRYNLGIYQ